MEFLKKEYRGWVTAAKQGRKTPAYILWYSPKLTYEIKDAFLMSFARDIENRLRRSYESVCGSCCGKLDDSRLAY